MREANAQIIIDVVMGELQKKESFSNSLAKVAKDAINKGLEKASKVRRTALSQAIINGVYKETPASKRAIKKLAKTTTLEVSKAIENYNTKHQSKGGFWNFVGSLAVNTGVLRFGQGYKGGNFFRDRYLDTYRTMDTRGQITESAKVNYGRVAGDILSAGQFLSNSIMTIANLIGQGTERIKQNLNKGMTNTQEIVAIASALGLKKGDDVRPVAAATNAVDSFMAGTSYENLTNTLFQYFRGDEAKKLARQAGFTGKTELDNVMEYIQSVITNEIFGKDGNLIAMTEEQRRARDQMAPVFGTKELRRVIQQQASVYSGPLFGINGGRYNGQETLYMKAYSQLGNKKITQEEYTNYQGKLIELRLMELSEYSKSFLSTNEETRALYESYFATQQQTIERGLRFFQDNGVKLLEANRKMEHLLGKIVDNTTVMVANLVNPSVSADTVRAGFKLTRTGLAATVGAGAGAKAGAFLGPLGALLGSVVGGASASLYILSQDD